MTLFPASIAQKSSWRYPRPVPRRRLCRENGVAGPNVSELEPLVKQLPVTATFQPRLRHTLGSARRKREPAKKARDWSQKDHGAANHMGTLSLFFSCACLSFRIRWSACSSPLRLNRLLAETSARGAQQAHTPSTRSDLSTHKESMATELVRFLSLRVADKEGRACPLRGGP